MFDVKRIIKIVWKKLHLKRKSTCMQFLIFFFTNVSSLKTFHNYSSDWHCFDLFAYFNSIWWSSLASVLSSFNCLICSVFPWYFKMFFFPTKDLTENDEHCRRFLERCMPESFQKVGCCSTLTKFDHFIKETWRVLNTTSLLILIILMVWFMNFHQRNMKSFKDIQPVDTNYFPWFDFHFLVL